MVLLILALAALAPHPRPLHTFKDWIVGCDNVRACQANALEPESAGDTFAGIVIERTGAPGDRAMLSVPLPEKTVTGARFALRLDGIPVATFVAEGSGDAKIPLTHDLARALADGRHLAIADANGAIVGEASLAGLAAALLFIDEQQGRVGTVGALKATGTRLDTTVGAPPAPPLIATPVASTRPPRTIGTGLAARLIGKDSAICDYASSTVKPRAYRLDGGHSLVLVDHPCGNGAYNFFTSVFVVDETGPPHPALFDLAPGMGEAPPGPGTGDLTNGDWDPSSRRIGSFEKGRGLGDCGSSESYAWDGARFRLVEQTEMGECRGSIDYIRTWIARTDR